MLSFDLNWLAVGAAVVASMVIGGIWYGPLFGKYWMKLIDKKPEQLKSPAVAMGGMVLFAIVQCVVLANFVGGAGVGPALKIAAWLWLGIIVPLLAGLWLFESRPAGLVWLPLGNQLLTLLAAAAILGGWPK